MWEKRALLDEPQYVEAVVEYAYAEGKVTAKHYYQAMTEAGMHRDPNDNDDHWTRCVNWIENRAREIASAHEQFRPL